MYGKTHRTQVREMLKVGKLVPININIYIYIYVDPARAANCTNRWGIQ